MGRAPYPIYSGDWGAMDSVVRRLLYLTWFSVLRFGPPRLPWQRLTSVRVAGWGTGPCGRWRANLVGVLCPLLLAWALEPVQPACFLSPDTAASDWPLNSVSRGPRRPGCPPAKSPLQCWFAINLYLSTSASMCVTCFRDSPLRVCVSGTPATRSLAHGQSRRQSRGFLSVL